MTQKIHFITYGDSRKYSISKKHLIHLAKISVIQFIQTFLKRLNTKFSKKPKCLELPRGGYFYMETKIY